MAELRLRLGADEAMVLLEWLADHTDDELGHLGERQALWNLEATLEPLVDELFAPDYTQRLERAEARLTPAGQRSTEQHRLVSDHPAPTAADPVAALTTDEATVVAAWLEHDRPPRPDGPPIITATSRLRRLIADQLPAASGAEVDGARQRLDWGRLFEE